MIQQSLSAPAEASAANGLDFTHDRPAAAMYPVKGVGYFCAHPKLWAMVLCPIICGVFLAIVMIFCFFAYLYEPQANLLKQYVDWYHVWAFMLTLVEIIAGWIITLNLVMFMILHGCFIRVMKDQGCWNPAASEECYLPIMNVLVQLFVAVVALPLHLIPVIGTVIYLALTGAVVAWEYHEIYFEMIGLTPKQQRNYVFSHFLEYLLFGLVSQLLLLIPFVGFFLFVSNICGAAMWAADLEKRRAGSTLPGTIPGQVQISYAEPTVPMPQGSPGMISVAAQPQIVVPAQLVPPQPELVSVVVPHGLKTGDPFQFTTPTGRQLQLQVPPGVVGGQVIQTQG